jgi:hypothetical protein
LLGIGIGIFDSCGQRLIRIGGCGTQLDEAVEERDKDR